MRPIEFWWQLEARKAPVMYGDMTEQEVAEIYEEAYPDGDK